MNGPEHYLEAERHARSADAWLDADAGWKAKLSTAERLAYRNSDLATGQLHATLALAAATALGSDPDGMRAADAEAWEIAASAAPDGDAPLVDDPTRCAVCGMREREHPTSVCGTWTR